MSDQQSDIVILGGQRWRIRVHCAPLSSGLSVTLIEKRNSAERVCIAAASRPKHCCIPLRSQTQHASPSFGVERNPRRHRHSAVPPTRTASWRGFKGLQGLVKLAKVNYVQGQEPLSTRRQCGSTAPTTEARLSCWGLGPTHAPLPVSRNRRSHRDERPGTPTSQRFPDPPSSWAVGDRRGVRQHLAIVRRRRHHRRGAPSVGGRRGRCLLQVLERTFSQAGASRFTRAPSSRGATQDDSGVTVTLEDGTVLTAELLLVAVGRGPHRQASGFAETNITMDRGFVLTDDRPRNERTSAFARSAYRPRTAVCLTAASRKESVVAEDCRPQPAHD